MKVLFQNIRNETSFEKVDMGFVLAKLIVFKVLELGCTGYDVELGSFSVTSYIEVLI